MYGSWQKVRTEAVAGAFYPSHPKRLTEEVQRLLEGAPDAPLSGRVRGLMVPHAGYRYSGPTAACGFRQLLRVAPSRKPVVYLIGPAHFHDVRGVAFAPFECFDTPLGSVPQAARIITEMAVDTRTFSFSARAHEPEHCIEVELPFLQIVLREFELVAMVCREPRIEAVAHELANRIGEDDVVVVSSDLSHFYPHDEAQRRDRRLLDAIVHGDMTHAAHGEACGMQAILILMRLAQLRGWRATVLDARSSADTGGPRDRVVGYAALAFTA